MSSTLEYLKIKYPDLPSGRLSPKQILEQPYSVSVIEEDFGRALLDMIFGPAQKEVIYFPVQSCRLPVAAESGNDVRSPGLKQRRVHSRGALNTWIELRREKFGLK